MAFDANDLTPHEQFVVERTRAGEVADFSVLATGKDKPLVRAGFLRKLLLGLDADWPVRTPGVRIKGARIEGALDLTDCAGTGLPALELERGGPDQAHSRDDERLSGHRGPAARVARDRRSGHWRTGRSRQALLRRNGHDCPARQKPA